jgi:class 3 adenylate cyclase/tetratricopeptide (TPR) repeat protein
MRCSNCKSDNPDGKRFCGDCGAALANICPKCGADNPDGKRFCGECGAALGANASAKKPDDSPVRVAESSAREDLEGERKTVTALFADIKGSTELMEDLDPEEARAIIDPALRLMIDAAHRYDGYVVQSTGDGIFALFGAPVAHEDHPQRALYAALRMQDEMRRYSAKVVADGGLPIEARIGVNTGEVVVRSLATGAGQTEYTPIGHTINLASRMQAVAPTGSIAISEQTRHLVEGYFALKPLGPTRVKGVPQPVDVFEVIGPGALRTRLDLSRARGFSKFVGRDREMATLEGALDAAIAGNGQVVGVVAEAGTGKSRLCFEFVERCRARGVRVNQGHCPAHGKTIPYLPLLGVLRDIFGISERDTDHEARRKIAGELLLLDDAFQAMLPILFDFMGVSDPNRKAPALSPEGRQQMLFAFVRHLTEARSAREPAVVFLDDLHWIDPGSDTFLAHAVAAVQNTRTLYLVNFRPEYRADWMRKPYYQQVALLPLGSDVTREMLIDLLGTGASVQELPARVHQRTGGNPFFIEEVVQSMVESGRLTGTRGNYQLVGSLDAVEIPATVQTVLASRIDRLGSDQKHLLQTASVIGQEFSSAILVAVAAADDHAKLSAAVLASSLDVLRDTEFILETALYPEVEYAFKHPLTQEVAYRSQLGERRAHLHAAVARTIEQMDAAKLDARAALLAYHWEQAGEALIAAKWYARAAEAAGVDSPADALRHWEKVRELLAPLPHSDESDVLRLQATSKSMVFGFRQGLSTEKLEELHTEGKALALALGDVRAQLRILYGVTTHYVNIGKVRHAISAGEEALALANSTGDPELVWVAREPLAYAHILHGDLLTALAMTERQIEISRDNPTIGMDIIGFGASNSFTHLGWVLSEVGRFTEAAEAFRRCEELARDHHENEVLVWKDGNLSKLLERMGDLQASLATGRRAIEAAEKIGSQFTRAVAHGHFGSPTLLAGDFDTSRKSLELALEIAREHRVGLCWEAEYQAVLAEAYLGLSDQRRARKLADEAIETSIRMETRVYEVRSRLARVRILLALDGANARAEIESELDCATDLVRSTGAISYEPQILVERARLAAIVGDAARSADLKNAAQRMFIAMGATGRAERLAEELS